MQTNHFESGSTVRLLIPEPVRREWKITGVDADSLAEVQAEHGAAAGYEFEWGQIIEEVIEGDPATAPCGPEDLSSLALCWLGQIFTSLPRYITPHVLLTCSTTAKSRAISR